MPSVAQLVMKYGSEGKAAGAVALEIEKVPAREFLEWPENFRSLVLLKQQRIILRLAGRAAGVPLATLQVAWRQAEDQDQQEEIDG